MAGRSPVDRGKGGIKRSMVVDACGIPLGIVIAPANRHDSPLLADTLNTLQPLGELSDRTGVYLDRAYDSDTTRQKLAARGLSVRVPYDMRPFHAQVVQQSSAVGGLPGDADKPGGAAAARIAAAVVEDEPVSVRQAGLGQQRPERVRDERPVDEYHGLACSRELVF